MFQKMGSPDQEIAPVSTGPLHSTQVSPAERSTGQLCPSRCRLAGQSWSGARTRRDRQTNGHLGVPRSRHHVMVVKIQATRARAPAPAASVSNFTATVRGGHGYHEVSGSRPPTQMRPPAPPAMKAVAIIAWRRTRTPPVLPRVPLEALRLDARCQSRPLKMMPATTGVRVGVVTRMAVVAIVARAVQIRRTRVMVSAPFLAAVRRRALFGVNDSPGRPGPIAAA